jgi:hypothetical protein
VSGQILVTQSRRGAIACLGQESGAPFWTTTIVQVAGDHNPDHRIGE